MFDDGRLWHLRHNLRRFGDGNGNGFDCRCPLKAVTLGGIEDVIRAEQRDFLRFAGCLVRNVHLFPEDDRTGFLAFLHAAAKLDGLTEGQPLQRATAV